MKHSEFNQLNHSQKSDIVWEWGYFITNRKEGKYNVVLFMVQDFFVEVYIDLSDNETESINGISAAEVQKELLLTIDQKHPMIQALLLKPDHSHKAA
jgi:hypothetical protein